MRGKKNLQTEPEKSDFPLAPLLPACCVAPWRRKIRCSLVCKHVIVFLVLDETATGNVSGTPSLYSTWWFTGNLRILKNFHDFFLFLEFFKNFDALRVRRCQKNSFDFKRSPILWVWGCREGSLQCQGACEIAAEMGPTFVEIRCFRRASGSRRSYCKLGFRCSPGPGNRLPEPAFTSLKDEKQLHLKHPDTLNCKNQGADILCMII